MESGVAYSSVLNSSDRSIVVRHLDTATVTYASGRFRITGRTTAMPGIASPQAPPSTEGIANPGILVEIEKFAPVLSDSCGLRHED